MYQDNSRSSYWRFQYYTKRHMAQAQFDYTAFTNRSARRGFQREEMLPTQTAPEAERQKSALFAWVRQKYFQNNSVFSERFDFLQMGICWKSSAFLREALIMFFFPLDFIFKHLHWKKNKHTIKPQPFFFFPPLFSGYFSHTELLFFMLCTFFHLLACFSFVLLRYIYILIYLDLQHSAWKEMPGRKCSALRSQQENPTVVLNYLVKRCREDRDRLSLEMHREDRRQ